MIKVGSLFRAFAQMECFDTFSSRNFDLEHSNVKGVQRGIAHCSATCLQVIGRSCVDKVAGKAKEGWGGREGFLFVKVQSSNLIDYK